MSKSVVANYYGAALRAVARRLKRTQAIITQLWIHECIKNICHEDITGLYYGIFTAVRSVFGTTIE